MSSAACGYVFHPSEDEYEEEPKFDGMRLVPIIGLMTSN